MARLGHAAAVVLIAGLVITAGCVGPLAGSDSPEDATPDASAGTGGSEDSDYDEYGGGGSTAPSVSLSEIPGPENTTYTSGQGSYDGSESLSIHFVEVGQSDSTLIRGPEATVLVDTGDWQGEEAISYLESEGIEEIDLMVLTHLDADHIGQADQILRDFDVKEIWMSGQSRSTNTFNELVNAVLETDTGYYEPKTGEAFNVGEMRLEVLYPETVPTNTNTGIVTRLVFGETEVLFTGDAEENAEGEILQGNQTVSSDIYQVGHHGSSTSSTQEFVEAVSPKVAVYSAGKDNQYGHPDDEVINRLNEIGADVYGTPVHGTVVVNATADEEITVSTESDTSPVTTPPTIHPGVHSPAKGATP